MIQPWTATCVQVLNHTVNHVSTREAAMEIVNRSLDRWEILVLGGIAPGQARPNNPLNSNVIYLATNLNAPISKIAKPTRSAAVATYSSTSVMCSMALAFWFEREEFRRRPLVAGSVYTLYPTRQTQRDQQLRFALFRRKFA